MIDTVTVAQHLSSVLVDVKSAPRDWVDYAQIVAALFVGPLIAIVAAGFGATLGGKLAADAGKQVQKEQMLLEDRRAYIGLRNVLIDEVDALTLRCFFWAKYLREQRTVTAQHVNRLRIEIEVYDQNIKQLGLFPFDLRRGVVAWYHGLKDALWLGEQLADEQAVAMEKSGAPQTVLDKMAPARNELIQKLQYAAEGGNELVERLKDAPDELPSEQERSPLKPDPPKATAKDDTSQK